MKQEEEKEGIVTEALLDSGATELVMSEEFARRHKFKKTKLERLVYVRNVDGMLNYVGPIVDTVEVEIFFKGHKYYESRSLGLDNEVTLYRIYTRELDGELCTE